MEHIEHINKVELQGHVGTVRANEHNGVKVVNFTLATELLYKTREGAAVVETTWHNVVAWAGKEMPDLRLIEKGAPVYVTGRMRSTKFTSSEGVDKYFYEIMANKVRLVKSESIDS